MQPSPLNVPAHLTFLSINRDWLPPSQRHFGNDPILLLIHLERVAARILAKPIHPLNQTMYSYSQESQQRQQVGHTKPRAKFLFTESGSRTVHLQRGGEDKWAEALSKQSFLFTSRSTSYPWAIQRYGCDHMKHFAVTSAVPAKSGVSRNTGISDSFSHWLHPQWASWGCYGMLWQNSSCYQKSCALKQIHAIKKDR